MIEIHFTQGNEFGFCYILFLNPNLSVPTAPAVLVFSPMPHKYDFGKMILSLLALSYEKSPAKFIETIVPTKNLAIEASHIITELTQNISPESESNKEAYINSDEHDNTMHLLFFCLILLLCTTSTSDKKLSRGFRLGGFTNRTCTSSSPFSFAMPISSSLA